MEDDGLPLRQRLLESFSDCFQVSSLLSEEPVSSLPQPPKIIPEGPGAGLGEVGKGTESRPDSQRLRAFRLWKPTPLHPTSGDPGPVPLFLPSGRPCSGKQLRNVDTHVNVVAAEDPEHSNIFSAGKSQKEVGQRRGEWTQRA